MASAFMDNVLGTKTTTTTTKKKKSSSGFMDSYLTDTTEETTYTPPKAQETPPPETKQPEKKKLTYMDPGYYDSEDFKTDITSKYDAAPDKQKFKNTLTNTELAVLNERRPDNKNFSNPIIYDASVKVKPMGFEEEQAKKVKAVQTVDKAIETNQLPEGVSSWDELVNARNATVRQIQTDNAKFYNEDGSPKGNVVNAFKSDTIAPAETNVLKILKNTVGGKAIEFKQEDLDPSLKKLDEAWNGVGTYSNGTVKRLDNAQSFVKGGAAVVGLVFSPLNFTARQIQSENPDDMSQAGNVIAKAVALPFEASKGVIKTGGLMIGMDEQDADDLATVLATIIPFVKLKGKEFGTRDLTTIVDRTNQTFSKIRDLDPNAKAVYRAGVKDVHPDTTGLPYSFMARFNDAATRGDVPGMKAIIQEGKIYRAQNPNISPKNPAFENAQVMRQEAAKGNENAIVRNGNYQEAVKTQDVSITNPATGGKAVSIETVGYGDTFAVRTTVTDAGNNSVSTTFQGDYPTKAEAVQAGATQAKELTAQIPVSPEVRSQIEAVERSPEAAIKKTEKITTAPGSIEKQSTMQISEWPYKGQFQVTVTEGLNKGKFAIGKTEESAQLKLQDVIAGKAVTREPSTTKESAPSNKKPETKPVSEPKKEVNAQTPSNKERLIDTSKIRSAAKALREKSEAEMNRPRQDNTLRRARMADSARDNARADIEFANTLEKLADSTDKGEIKHLSRVQSKADLSRVERLHRIAENRASRELKKPEKELTSKDLEKFADFDKTRMYMSKYDVEKVKPSEYGKATKAGVDLKGFLKAASGEAPFSIPKWEKEMEYLSKHADEIFGRDATSSMKDLSDLTTYRALTKIKGDSTWAEVFDELKSIKEGSKVTETPAQKLAREERDLVQRTNIDGFFPTPPSIVDRMIEEAGIEKGMKVLEPSAGIGSIADKIREAGVEPDVGEYATSLSQHLEKKGYNVVSSDFLEMPKSQKYDRIIMNPPFEKMQDVEHVQEAFEHLNPGGKIVAIMGESPFFNGSKKAVEFREWLDEVGGWSEKLPEGSFKDSLRQTGVATRLVTIEKDFSDRAIERGAAESIEAGKPVGEIGGTTVPESVTKRKSNGSALQTKGGDGLSNFEKVEQTGNKEAFKLSQRVKELIDKLDTNFTKYVAPGSVGTFYTRSKNIAVQSLNDVSTVQHELSHLIDDRLGITEKVMNVIGKSKTGLPVYDQSMKPIRDELTKIYTQYYPGAKKGDRLKIRMMEGYAVLQQKALETPSVIKKEYPKLWDMFVENGQDLQKQLNDGMRKIVDDWQGLNANDRIGSVVTDITKNEKAKDFLNTFEKVEEMIVDNIARFEKLDRKLGQKENPKSVSNLLYANNSAMLRTYRNIAEKGDGYWTFRDGELTKVADQNWADLIAMLGSEPVKGSGLTERAKAIAEKTKRVFNPQKSPRVDTFSNYLVARDQIAEWERLDAMKEGYESAKAAIKSIDMQEAIFRKTNPEIADTVLSIFKKERQGFETIIERYEDLEKYLKRNSGILPRSTMQEMVDQYKDDFVQESEIFDRLVAADLTTLKDSGILSKEKFDEYSQKQGYAPMRRLIEDDVLGTPSQSEGMKIGGVKITKPKQLQNRKGGTHDIISPLLGAISNHREAMRKSYRQAVNNRLYDTLLQFPDLAQEVSIETTVTPSGKVMRSVNGKDILNDPNIITKMVDGKPQAMIVADELRKPLEDIFTPTAVSIPEAFFVGASRLFSKGTTGIYPLFAITNAIRDQFTAMVHTKENYIPVVDQIRQLVPALLNKSSPEAKFAREYLSIGGSKITRLNFNEATGAEILKHLEHEETGLKKAARWLESGLDILAIPANWSEIGTRMVEYVKARKAGKDMWTAFEEAGQLTAPFHHKGTFSANAFGRGWFRSAPYLNAIMQGIAQFTKSMRTKEGALRYGVLALGNAAVVMYAINSLLADSDDETKRAYVQLEPTSLSKFIYIPKGNGELYKIPIPQELAWLGTINAMVQLDAKYGANFSAKEYVDAALSFLPDAMQVNDPGKAIIAVMPQLLKPALETMFNKVTFPNVRDLETKADLSILPHLRGNKGTSAFSAWLAQKAYDTNGTEISPIKIDHLLEGYFGRVIGYATGKPSAYDPQSPILQKEYFTSGRMLQKFFELSDKNGQEYTSAQKGLISYPDKKLIEINAQRDRIQEVWDAIKDFKDQTGWEANKSRTEVWQKVNKLLNFKPEDVTQEDVQNFEKKQAAAEWKNTSKDLVEEYTQKFKDSTDAFKRTRLEKELRQQIQGSSKIMTDEQKNHFDSVVGKLRMEWAAQSDDFVKQLSEANLNADKAKLLVDKRRQMITEGKTAEDFTKYLRDLQTKKAVSDDVVVKVNILIKKE